MLWATVFVACSATQTPDEQSDAPASDGGCVQAAPTPKAADVYVDVGVDVDVDGGSPGDGTDAGFSTGDGPTPKVLTEARGLWVTRWDFSSPEDIAQIMERISKAGFNQVYFQVRGAADAYYRSSLEPWAAALTGKLGRDPGWDPLQVAIEQAHARELELHVWLNVCTGWKGKKPPGRSKPKHMLRAHPEWRMRDENGKPMPYSDGAYVFVNPAHPGFQRHIEAVVAEIVSFYAVDGLHLDYTRYPASGFSTDKTTRKRHRAERKTTPGLSRAQWQREELTRLVARIKAKVIQVRPGVVVSAAVTGIYINRWAWDSVTQGKLDFHQDSHLWAERGAVDSLIPMIYWPPTRVKGARTDFLTLIEDFAPLRKKISLLAGLNVDASNFETLVSEIEIAREKELHGVVLFAYKTLEDRGWFERLGETVFSKPAKAPGPPERARVGLFGLLQSLECRTVVRSMVTTNIQFGWPSLAWLNSLAPWSVSISVASAGLIWPARAPR